MEQKKGIEHSYKRKMVKKKNRKNMKRENTRKKENEIKN
jgi:hypothetical protein